MAFLQNTADWILVAFVNSTTGIGVTAIAWNDANLSFKVCKPGAAEATYTLTGASDWVEAGHGWYYVKLSATATGYGVNATDTVGQNRLLTLYGAGTPQEGGYPYEIRANTEAEIYTRIGADGAGLTALGDARIAHLDADVSSRLAPTVAARTLDVAATGEAGVDFDNIKQASGATTLTNIRVPNVTLTDTVTTYTGNTPQTGDVYASLGKLFALNEENTVFDNLSYTGSKLDSARIRAYDSKANAQGAGVTGLLFTWTVTYTYTGNNCTGVTRVLEP